MGISEKEIIEGCKKKDKKCQRILYDKYADVLFGVCRKNSRCKEDAEDIFQEAFIKAFDNLEKYSYKGSFEGWLKKLFIRVAWNYYRSKKDNKIPLESDDWYVPKAENSVMEEFSNELFLNCLARLEDKERMILVMSEIDEVPFEEIAQITKLQISTIRSMCSRAKKKLINMFYNLNK